ncbi:Cdc37 N terminal kinase binding-domain-containing protein [Lactarius quietus]|nr:Cdc37 N terminal kinase binding-domain-containing protein [Lactarius quietus]
MPLNYAKWEIIELSDDSDIECHPNVHKKSLIRFHQRTTREKRKERNHRIEQLSAEVACNEVLLARLRAFQHKLAQSDSSCFSSEVYRLRTNPSPEAPLTNVAEPVPYDEMILSLLQTIAEEAQEQAYSDKGTQLEERLEFHVNRLESITEERKKERDALLKEKSEHITMDDLHEGLESKYVPPKPPSSPAIVKVKQKDTSKAALAPSTSTSTLMAQSPDNEYADIPYMTPSLEEFAKLPLGGVEKLWPFIQNHPEVVVPSAPDALLVAAYWAQMDGKSKHAKQCVHRSQVLEYIEKLGKDGVRLFFHSMAVGGEAPHSVFRRDVEEAYGRVVKCVEIDKQKDADYEIIQFVAHNSDTAFSFNVPDGPPPEHYEGTDVEEAHEALQMRWDIFCGLPETLQEALKTNHLAAVNEVLGRMPVSAAKNAALALDKADIISVETKQAQAARAEDDAGKTKDAS